MNYILNVYKKTPKIYYKELSISLFVYYIIITNYLIRFYFLNINEKKIEGKNNDTKN